MQIRVRTERPLDSLSFLIHILLKQTRGAPYAFDDSPYFFSATMGPYSYTEIDPDSKSTPLVCYYLLLGYLHISLTSPFKYKVLFLRFLQIRTKGGLFSQTFIFYTLNVCTAYTLSFILYFS